MPDPARRSRASLIVLAAGLVVSVVYPPLPRGGTGQAVAMTGLAAAGSAVVFARARRTADVGP